MSLRRQNKTNVKVPILFRDIKNRVSNFGFHMRLFVTIIIIIIII